MFNQYFIEYVIYLMDLIIALADHGEFDSESLL